MSAWSALTGENAADAANAAASDTWQKQDRAIKEYQLYGNTLPGKYAELGKGYDPYIGAGNDALSRLLAGLGLGGNQQNFTDAYRSLPGYQAGLDTGSRAISGNAAARGMLNSGTTLKALQRYGSDYEDRRVKDYLAQLAGLASNGQTATGAQIGTSAAGIGAQTGVEQGAFGGRMLAANTIGLGNIAAANAQSQGIGNLVNTGAKLLGSGISALSGGMGGFGGFGGGASAFPVNPGG